MDELVSVIIEVNTCECLAQIAYTRVNQHITDSIRLEEQELKVYYVGSYGEGMNNLGDVDIMQVLSTFPVVLWPSQARENQNERKESFVIAEQNPEEPAFLKLSVVDRSCIHEDFRNAIDMDGYFSSTTFITSMKSTSSEFISDSVRAGMGLSKIQGPSLKGGVDFTMRFDCVFCLKCKSWPSSISCEYLNRKRQDKWPPQKLLNEIVHMDCLVVAVGHPTSPSKDIEWRLSFSLAEKELIQRMSKPFINCMYALKSIKNKYIVYSDSDNPTPFCSYFIKTACLWMCETLPHKDYSIMNLIRRVLDWLIDSYKNRNLPHYFIPEQNLIGHLPMERRDDVIAKLTAVKKDIWTMVMTSVDRHHLINYVIGLCDKLKIPVVNGDDDYKTVELILLNHPKATEYLEQCISKVRYGDKRLGQFKIRQCATWVGIAFTNPFTQIDLLIQEGDFSEILGSPEDTILPIVDNIDEIVPEGYGDMFKTRLYRVLGDMYTYLLIYLRKIGYHDYPAIYQNKPLEYYNLGAKMMYLNKWSDKCIGGRVHKVQYHYLMGNYEILKKILDWKPLLSKLKENDFLMNSVCTINIHVDSEIVLSAWDIDKKLQQCFECPVGTTVAMNPIVFIFYVMTKVHLREGDLEKASAIVKEMKGCSETMVQRPRELPDLTESMIELVEFEILSLWA
ncbi:uncharacterized protein LOC117120154 [Anneissia japonica]|uniref:uncharacterized protein LOC117120154 n=1 Tax=Anneissia japonica TaxID=1529436 RepID=UPI001425B4F0|nr:uncharacterized protein LOC117120154 [Anneissia japonica]